MAKLTRSACSSTVWFLMNFAALAVVGILLFFQAGRRLLSVHEKLALRGGGTYVSRCCKTLTQCKGVPKTRTCSWYTTLGTLQCKRGLATQYQLSGSSKSCIQGQMGTTCTLGAEAPCVQSSVCTWNYTTSECQFNGVWSGYTPGYASCSPGCSS